MADLKVLLTADLNVAQTTKDINIAIAKIQDKIVKLKLQVDTKALKDAGVLIRGLNESASNAGAKANQVAQSVGKVTEKYSQTLSSSRNDMKEFRNAMARVNSEIAKTSPESYRITKNAKGEVQRATAVYKEMGKTIQKNFAWVTKTVGNETTTTFKQVSEQVVNNSSQAAARMRKIYKDAGDLKYNLTSGKTNIFDAKENAKLVASYDLVQRKISSAQKDKQILHGTTLKGIEEEIAENKRLTDEIIRQQRARITNSNLGRNVIGNSGGLNFGASSDSKIISNAQTQLNSYLSSSGIGGKATAKDFNIDSVKLNQAGKAVATLSARVEVAKDKFATFKIKVDQASDSTRIFGQRLNQASKANLTFMDQLKTAMARIPIWMIGMTAFYQSLRFFTDGVKYVNDFNQSLTQLSIVFNQSQSTVAKYTQQFHELGMQMSISTAEVAKGAVEFARQGLVGAEMMDKMKTATIYAKISNLDFTQSAEILTATVNSMGVSAEHAADIFSYMGDATATGSDEIGKAMQKVGGTAGAIGLEFEKVSSWIATISSRTRESAETIGSSVKSIMARVQSLKETGFDETDGTQVNQVSKALNRVGIQLVDAQGNFRNFGTVMDELGAKWGSLTNRQQAYIATTVAGSYQQSRFLNIMEGYPDSVKLYEESLNQAGIATEKFNRYQEGTEAHLTRMRNAWNNIFQSSFDSEGIRTLIDAITTLGNAVNSVIKTIGIVPVVVGVATIAFMIFGKTAHAALGASLTNLILHPIAAFNNLYNSIGKVTVGLIAQSHATSKATIAMGLMKNTSIALMRSLAPLALFMAVAWGIQQITGAIHKHNAAVKEAKTVNYELRDSYKEQKKGIQGLMEEYNSLTATEDKTIEQKNRLLDIQNELVTSYGVTATGIDAEGNAYVNSASAIQERIDSLNELIRIQNEINKAKVIGNFTENGKDIKETREEYEKNQRVLKDLEEQERAYLAGKTTQTLNVDVGGGNMHTVEIKTDIEKLNKQKVLALQALSDSKSELDKFTAGTIDAVKNAYNERLDEAGKTITNEQRQFADSLSNVIGQMDFKTFDGQVDALEQNLERFETVGINSMDKLKAYFSDNGIEFSGVNVQQLSLMFEQLTNDVYKNYKNTELTTQLYGNLNSQLKMSRGAVSALVDAFRSGEPVIADNADLIEDSTFKVESYKKSLEELQATYDESSSTLETLNGFLKDNADGKSISADAVMKLVAKDKSLTSLFRTENGVIKLNISAIKKKRTELIQALKDEGQAQINALTTQNRVLVEKMKSYGIELGAITNIGEAIDSITSKTENFIYYARKMGEEDLIPGLESSRDEMISIVEAFGELKTQAELGVTALSQVGDESEDTKESVTKLQRAIDNVDAALAKVESKQDRYAKSSKKYRAAVQEEINLLNKKKGLLLEASKDPSKLIPTTTTTTTTSSGSGEDVAKYSGGTGVKATGNIKEMIKSTANNVGVDASILDALVWAESTYNPTLTSKAGAAGLTQLMPGTARGLGVKDVFNPQQNLTGGAKYLDQMYRKYGSYDLALAAYNAGPGYVDWAIKVTGSKDWNVIKNAKADVAKPKLYRKAGDNIFKSETKTYVPKVLNYAQSGKGDTAKIPVVATTTPASTTTSTKNNFTTTTTVKETSSEDVADKIKSIEDGILDVDNKLYAASRDMLDSYIAQFDMGLEAKDKAIADSQFRAARVDPSSKAYTLEVTEQIAQLKVKQKLMHEEAELIRNSGIESDDLTQKVTGLSASWQEVQDVIDGLNGSLADQSVNKFERAIEETNNELAMSSARLATYKDDSKEYRDELLNQIKINEVLQKQKEDEAIKIRAILKENEKSNKLSIEKVEEYNAKLVELKIAWWEIEGAMKSANDSLTSFNEDIATKAIDLLKNMYEKQKDAIVKAIDEQDKALEKAHKKEMDRIEEKLKADQKVIDSKIKQLEFDKSESDYAKDLEKKTASRQELQDKINRLSMDNSKEGKAQLKDLINQRDEADEEIAKLKEDHSLEAQKTELENQKTTLEDQAEAEKKAWSMSVELWDATTQQMVTISGKSYDDMKEIIDDYKDSANKYFEDIANNEKYWSDMKTEIEKGNISVITGELNKLKGWFDTNLPIVGQNIYESITMNLEDVISKLKIIRTESDAISEMQANSAKWKTASAEEKKALEAANNEIGSSIGAKKDNATGVWYDANGKPLFGTTSSGTSTGISGTTTSPTTSSNSTTISKMKANAEAWHTANADEKARLSAENNKLGASIGLSKKANGHWYDKNGLQVLHKGGIVGGAEGADAKTRMMDQFLNTDADERVIKALEGELMSPSHNIASKAIPNIGKLVSRLLPQISVSAGGDTFNINIGSVMGTKEGADSVTKAIIKGIKKRGGKF